MSTWSNRSSRDRRARGRSAALPQSGWTRIRRSPSTMGRFLLCGLLALLVVGMNYLPWAVAESCRSYLSYCFQPGAAAGTPFEAWADWQPNAARLSAVWQRLTGGDQDDALAYPCTGRVSSGYGWRYNPVSGQLEMHYGLDIVSEEGTSVAAAGAGSVVSVNEDEDLGLCLTIDHGDGITALYGHLQSVMVAVGDKVNKGDEIAVVGNTGVTNDVHLHFALLVNGEPEDPLPKLQGDR